MRSSLVALGAFVLSAAHICSAQEGEESIWKIEASKSPCDRAEDLAKKLAIATLRGTDEDISYVDFGADVNFTVTVLGNPIGVEDETKTVTGFDEARKLLKEVSPHDKDADPKLLNVAHYESSPVGNQIEDLMIGGLHETPGGKDRKWHHIATEMIFNQHCDILSAKVHYGDLRSQEYQDWVKELEEDLKKQGTQAPSSA